jgi:hypothetical protein
MCCCHPFDQKIPQAKIQAKIQAQAQTQTQAKEYYGVNYISTGKIERQTVYCLSFA